MLRRLGLAGLLLAVLWTSSWAAPAPSAQTGKSSTRAAAVKPSAPVLQFEKYKLKNGLEVILSEDHRLPLVAVDLWYHVGPAYEKPGRTGFAHLYEHMMFQGSSHVGEKAHVRYLEGAGATDINGTTDFDRTNYFETLPSNQLELALWLESDRMGFLLPTLDQAKLANQRDVVRNERRQGSENTPYQLVEEGLYHQLFPKNHPYYGVVIGSHADIEAARLGDVREFFKLYYGPKNASLAIVGDFDPAKTKALIEKYFGSLPSGENPPKIEVKTPAITEERRATVTDRVELPRIYMGWITTPIFKPGDAEDTLLARILGGGKSSRLYKKLVYEKQIAQDVDVQQQSLMLGSVFEIQATAQPGVKLEELEAAIDEELAKMREQGPTPAELQAAKNIVESQIIRNLERLGGFGGRADRLDTYNHFLGDPGYLPKDLARYRDATVDGVRKVAATELTKNSRAVVYGVPGEKVIEDVARTNEEEEKKEATKIEIAKADPKEDWRIAPKPAAASKLTLPTPKEFKLENGLSVLLVEQHDLPVFAANLVVLSGSEANPADKPGLASFTADMLDEGTGRRSTLQFADEVEAIGAMLKTNSTADDSTIAVRALKKNADAAFDLMADAALHPAFDPKELERVRKQRITAILQERDDPNQVSRIVFYRAVYGDKHPYGFMELGTEGAAKQITRDDLVKFWSAGYVPQDSALVIAGDLTQAEARALAEKYFGAWKGQAHRTEVPAPQAPELRRIVIVDKPGAPQTRLRIGEVGVARSTPDYAALEVMNAMLGGLFSSRINMNLREKHGYTYGAGSAFLYRRGPGPFFAGLGGVRTDVTAPSVKEIFNELERMRTTDLTRQELVMSKDSISRSLVGLFESTPSAAASVGDLFVYNLPLNYYTDLPSTIDRVTTQDVRRVAEKYLKLDSMVIVAVGDRAKIEPELNHLKLGQVELRDLDGNPVKGDAAQAH
jgi:zinc protease